MCMLALIRLGACVCSVLREHVSAVFCKPVCSVCYANMRVFMHHVYRVCVGGVCVCIHTELPAIYILPYMQQWPHVLWQMYMFLLVYVIRYLCALFVHACVSMYTCALVCTYSLHVRVCVCVCRLALCKS